MKTLCSVSLRMAFMAIILMSGIVASAQRSVTWKGGTPGMKNDWNCPQNWSTHAVPDEFSNVFIPDVSTTSLSAPVIRSGKIEINQLSLESNAHLTIEKAAELVVFGHAEGIRPTNLQVNGTLLILYGGNTSVNSIPLVKN